MGENLAMFLASRLIKTARTGSIHFLGYNSSGLRRGIIIARRPLTLSRISLHPVRVLRPRHSNYSGTPPVVLPKFLHTSSPRPAPQFLILLFAPVSRFLVAIGGRLTRSWWSRLTQERRGAIKASMRKNQKYFYTIFGISTLCGVGYYISHLEETPLTHRRRFIMFHRDDVLSMIESEKKNILEALCGDKQVLLDHDHPAYKHVHKIVSRIIAANDIPEFEGFDWGLYICH